MGRMWNTLLLYKWKPIFAWLPIETLIRKRRDAYYAALGQADISADAIPFVEFLLSVIYGCRGTAAGKRASAGKIALQRRAQPNGNRSINQGVGESFPNKQQGDFRWRKSPCSSSLYKRRHCLPSVNSAALPLLLTVFLKMQFTCSREKCWHFNIYVIRFACWNFNILGDGR